MTNANSVIFELISKSKTRIDVCGDFGIQKSFHTVDDLFENSLRDSKNSSGITPRCIIEITKEKMDYCRRLMKTADLRHMDNLKGNFVLNGMECVSVTLALKKGKIVSHLVNSAIKETVEQQQYVFDTFWKIAIPAKEKIEEIEGRSDNLSQPKRNKNDIVKVIRDKDEIEALVKSCIYNARSEVLIAISSIHHLTYLHKIGLEGSLKHAKLQGSTIILLYPEDESNVLKKNMILLSFIDNMRKYAQIKGVSGFIGNILLVDNSKILTISTEDWKEHMGNSVGVYTDNKPIVTNFGSLFDTLLSEKELLNSIISVKKQLERSNMQLLESNERLKINFENQKEFINIAAHELRTPTQAIMGYTEMLEGDPNNYHQYINSISRNANRLEKLVENLLDTAKIESDSLTLKQEKTDLKELLFAIIQSAKMDLENTQKKERKTNIKFYHASKGEKINKNESIEIYLYLEEKHMSTMSSALYVMVDREKFTQAISNLLRNSIKSIGDNGGRITVTVSKRDKEKNGSFAKNEILISFKDTGKGIDSEIHPRLFKKFMTNSSSGTGLGLYITKSIIEAHGGQIWAENNADGKGATFSFILPAL